MAKMVGSYSIQNLIQSTEYLLQLTRSLNDEINNFETTRDEVRNQQNLSIFSLNFEVSEEFFFSLEFDNSILSSSSLM